MKLLIILFIFLSCEPPTYENNNIPFIKEKELIPEWLHGLFLNTVTEEAIYGSKDKITIYLENSKYELDKEQGSNRNNNEYYLSNGSNSFVFIKNTNFIVLRIGENHLSIYTKK